VSLTKVSYSMIQGAPVNLADFGFSTSNTALGNRQAIENAIASGAKCVIAAASGDYNIDNATPIVVNSNDLEFQFARGVNFKPNTPTVTVFSVTGQNVLWNGGSFEGNGTYNNTGSSTGRSVSFIEVYNGPSPTAPQNVTIQNVVMVDPNNTGIQLWRTVGVTIQNCSIKSNYAGAFIAGIFGISVYSCANVTVQGNTVDGFIEGCVGGGENSYVFTDFTSVATSSNSRNVIFANNQINNFIDHGIYFSSNAEKIVCSDNSFTSFKVDAQHSIALFGTGNVVTGNVSTCTIGGFRGRAVNDSVISGNTFRQVTDGGAGVNSALIVLDAWTGSSIEMADLVISNNFLVAVGKTDYGIYLFSTNRVSDGGQNLMRNIVIEGNVISGQVGGANAGSPAVQSGINIFVQQHSTPASSAFSNGLVIADNVLDLSADCLYGIYVSGQSTQSGFNNASIVNNVLKNYKTTGILASLKDSHVSGNVFSPTGAAAAVQEITNVNTPSGNNYYGRILGITTGAEFSLVSQTSAYEGRLLNYIASLGTDTTLQSFRPFQRLVFGPTATRAVTLSVAASAVFPVGYAVVVSNISGANNLTFELSPGGSTSLVTPNTSPTFVCVGSNTFIRT
jgi:hypothetical protein